MVHRFHLYSCRWLLVFFCLLSVTGLRARAESSPDSSVPALLVSDVHLDPFHDPARVNQLDRAPVSQWAAILSSPLSKTQAQDAVSLQENCPIRGIDTPYPLFRSSLDAMRAQKPAPKFITVSGDLISHNFKCRYRTLMPNAADGAYDVFVEKTITFVSEQIRAAFPGVPVYIALGNNDAVCDDYKLDANSAFLAEAGRVLGAGLPDADRAQAEKQIAIDGDYSAHLPLPKTRILVLDDLFFSVNYEDCRRSADPHPALQQLVWLEAQLADARAHGEKIWVMAHIPPGVDVFATMMKFRAVCHNEPAQMFLSDWLNTRLIDLLEKYGDVIRLGIFAHTHMDEMRLLRADGNGSSGGAQTPIAIKMVPSISPVNGNAPAFTLAAINENSATLTDYRVITASNSSGLDTRWSEEYDFANTYHVNEYTPQGLAPLLDGLAKDDRGQSATAHAYIHNYYAGGRIPAIGLFWSEYRCSLDNTTAKSYAACECQSAK
ncbi:metallophosphoesterase [Silvibacterium sp.]|uniref:metallophosphoesterase n=1 Tax=Silvibacterium sp. TaxID=1964179 RepID=UPI0039E4D8CE